MGPARFCFGLVAALVIVRAAAAGSAAAVQWTEIGGSAAGQRYSALDDIRKDNVARLQPVWTYRSGDFSKGNARHGATALQVTPLMVEGTLYFCTPYNRVIALDAESGRQRWVFDPETRLDGVYTPACRGVAWWRDAQAAADAPCRDRIFTGTLDARLLALDARTGKACAGFGGGAGVNLLEGLGEVREAEYYSTSPPQVVHDLVLTGAFVRDGQRLDAPGGAVRAFDARSGALRWVFDPVPPGRKAVTADDLRRGATLTRGTPNVWGLMSADPEHQLVFLPMGNASPDHYGGAQRADMDYFSASIVALDSTTGAVRWRFQTVHHDVWDYDVGAQPTLYQHRWPSGEEVPALIAATKLGHVFLLNRLTGEPLFPVEERPVPQSGVPGEKTSPTQPFPTRPRPLHDARLDRSELWGLTFWDKGRCEAAFDALDYQGMFTPPSLKGSLEYPGLGGGINWGGASVDPVNRRMVVALQTAPFVIRLVPRAQWQQTQPRPPAEGTTEKPAGVRQSGEAQGSDLVTSNPQEGTPYVAVRNAFLSPLMTPCVKPPWGRLVAVDLSSGEVSWDRNLGNLHGLAPLVGDRLDYGTPNSGGSLQTAGGLVFIGASMDQYFRAFDAASGAELWRYQLPYAAHATPMSYRTKPGGRQYLVIAAGGHGPLGTEPGDVLMAFALADE